METVVFVLMILVCFNFMLKQTYRKLRSVLVISVICALFVGLMWPYAIEQSKTQIADWLANPDARYLRCTERGSGSADDLLHAGCTYPKCRTCEEARAMGL